MKKKKKHKKLFLTLNLVKFNENLKWVLSCTYKGNIAVPDRDQMFSPKTTQGTAGAKWQKTVIKLKYLRWENIAQNRTENSSKNNTHYI